MDLNALTAISPLDGRYRNKTDELAPFFSEYGLIKYRVLVEVEYVILLNETQLKGMSKIDEKLYPSLRNLYINFSIDDALTIKNIEKTTNHDVKAVEYFLKEKFEAFGLNQQMEFIHFGLTSQDINNTATPLLLKEGVLHVYTPFIA
jgi:adenylosuccinate lyase